MNITKRQAQILAAIVKEYSKTNHPVGSLELAENYNFGVSPATIRNEMQVLEKEELIIQPHTSAGRVPTDHGYRLFVNKLMKHLELRESEQARLKQELLKLQRQYLELGQSLTKLISSQTHGVAFAMLPDSTTSTGLSQVIGPDSQPEEIKEVAQFLEDLEESGQALLEKDIKEVKTFIGKESPVPLSENYSLLVTRVSLPDGKQGTVGIVGPKRMSYARNISVLDYVKKLLAGGIGTYLLLINF